MVFHSKETVPGRALLTKFRGVFAVVIAERACVHVPASGTRLKIERFGAPRTRYFTLLWTQVLHFYKAPAARAMKNEMRVSGIPSDQVARKQVNIIATPAASLFLNPEEVLDIGWSPAFEACRGVEFGDFLCNIGSDFLGRLTERRAIDTDERLTDYPKGHWVDVKADDVAASSVGFEKGGATTHEGVANSSAIKSMWL
jgi:hypothetical protein